MIFVRVVCFFSERLKETLSHQPKVFVLGQGV
jgi:hypothetical protein